MQQYKRYFQLRQWPWRDFFQQGSLALTDMPDIDILSTIKEINSVDKRFTSEAHMAKVLFSHKKYKGIVTAESAENNLVFESGTNVFLSDGTAVGVIQTLFGPLERPLYIVRGEEEHIERLTSSHQLCADVHLHTDVRQQIVMHSTEMYLNKSHATDASYVNDEELPEYVRPDFSDDEKEMLWKRERKQQRHNIHDSSVSSEDECVHNDIDWSTIKWDMEN